MYCFWQGSNLRPSACEADVITTTLQKLLDMSGKRFVGFNKDWDHMEFKNGIKSMETYARSRVPVSCEITSKVAGNGFPEQ